MVRTGEMDWTGLKLLLEGLEGKRVRKRYSLPSVVAKALQIKHFIALIVVR